MDRSLIENYVAGGSQLRQAYQGLTRQQLLAVPIPGTWTLHQIALHMMDSDLIASDRMKRIASMDKPLLIGYDETAFSKLPGSEDIEAAEAIDLFDRNRQLTARILRKLPDEAFERFGIHNESGKVTLQYMVKSYIDHLDGHLRWVIKKRAMV
ncbi:MAG: DinB family protein [Pirellulaceae bacterium]|nr:DinB family protein [Pirellulaceae bacterium]